MAKKYTTYRTLKKWVRILIKTMIIVFFAVGVTLIYKSLNLNAVVRNIPEYQQPKLVYGMLKIYNPDILVITRTWFNDKKGKRLFWYI